MSPALSPNITITLDMKDLPDRPIDKMYVNKSDRKDSRSNFDIPIKAVRNFGQSLARRSNMEFF